MPKGDPAGYLPSVRKARARSSDGDMRKRAATEMARKVATLRKGNPKRPAKRFKPIMGGLPIEGGPRRRRRRPIVGGLQRR